MLTYFDCPDNVRRPIKDSTGILTCENCSREINPLTHTRRCMALSHLYAISEQRKWLGKASVTQLIKGTRLAWLEITQDYSVKPDSRAFLLYGTYHHQRLESVNRKLEGLTEFKIEDDELSGTIDRLEPDQVNNGFFNLIDYKFVGAYSVAKALGLHNNTGVAETEEWELQDNRYRLLVEMHQNLKNLFPISGLFIQATLRDSGLKTQKEFNIPSRMPLIPIKKRDNQEILDYFGNKNEALLKYLKLGEMPPMCSYLERWSNRRCVGGYCELKAFCPEGRQMRGKK